MPTAKSPIDDRLTVRLGKVSKKLSRAAKQSGQRESEIVRAALSHFFDLHPTAESVISAVIAARSKEAA